MDDSQIPIDIHTNKLMDWLISRRHVPRDWQTKVYGIREKINEAIKDMPVHEGIAALLSGAYINYYHCQKIVKILEETESSSKNFFGQYGSQRMKDWKEVLRLYEKDNIYLGEVASLLLRNVNYEVPALRKQIQKLGQTVTELDKKSVDYEKQANNVKNELNSSFKELGIQGKNIRLELIKKAVELPKLNQKIALDSKKLKEAVNFYVNSVAALTDSKREVLKELQVLIAKGDITVYEWRTGTPPSSVESQEVSLQDVEEKQEEDVIDFGLDLDLDVAVEGDIDWGISTDDSSTTAVTVKSEPGLAKGTDARSILGHPATRTLITNDVLELEAFLKLRQHEVQSGDSLSLSMLPDALVVADEKTLAVMLDVVRKVLLTLNNATALHFLNINTNPMYVDQLTKKLIQKRQTQEKLLASKEFVKVQRGEFIKEAEALNPKVELLIEKTHELQNEIEADISRRYNGRPVNLMGGVNTL